MQDFKSEIKLFLTVAVISAVLAVGGILLLRAGLGPSSPTSSSTPPPAPAPVPSPQPQMPDTAGWQTYRNDEFGFELKYPEEWLVEDNLTTNSCCLNIFNSTDPYDKEGFFRRADVMKVQFQYHVDESISSKEDYIDTLIKESEEGPNASFPQGTINRASIHIFTNENGVHVLEFSEGLPGDLHYVIPVSDDFSERVHVLVWNPDVTFNQILATFRFTP